jgi:divalent metal cation (Fe/Co/Zn/Cd) transporter
LVGILFAKNIWWIDSALGIIIALMLFHAAYEVIKESVANLLGEQPSPELIEQITEEVKKVYLDDLQLHDFQLHNYITHKELIFHIRLRKELSIQTGHQIASDIEKNIQKRFEIHATIHVEPLL